VTPRRRINLVYPNEEHELGELHLTGLRTRVAAADWTGVAILVIRPSMSLQAALAAYPFRSPQDAHQWANHKFGGARQGDTPVAIGGAVFGACIGFVGFHFFFLLGAGLGQSSPTMCRMYGICGGLGGGAFGALLFGGLGAGIDHLFGERSTFYRRVAPCLLGIVIGFLTAFVLLEVTYPANVEMLNSLEFPLRAVLEQMGLSERIRQRSRDAG
jgi:hypothetical protein